MILKQFRRNIDVTKSSYIPIIKLKQGERLTSQLELLFFNNNNPYNIEAREISAIFQFPSKEILYQTTLDSYMPLLTDNNKLTLNFQPLVTDEYGQVDLEIRVLNEVTGELIISQLVIIFVEPSIDVEKSLKEESKFVVLETLIKKIEDFGDFKGDKGDRGEQGIQGETGETGAGLKIIGELSDEIELPDTGMPGDGYLIHGFFWVWSGSSYENVGRVSGPEGPMGQEGPMGPSAYDIWVSNGNEGTTDDFLESLKSKRVDTYIHRQRDPSNLWVIPHNLRKYPSITIEDSSNTVVIGSIKYTNENEVTVEFIGEFSGKAYLN